jgi:hypothetical protein
VVSESAFVDEVTLIFSDVCGHGSLIARPPVTWTFSSSPYPILELVEPAGRFRKL